MPRIRFPAISQRLAPLACSGMMVGMQELSGLSSLALLYAYETEAHDRRVCSWPLVHGIAIPKTPQERASCNQFARALKDRLRIWDLRGFHDELHYWDRLPFAELQLHYDRMMADPASEWLRQRTVRPYMVESRRISEVFFPNGERFSATYSGRGAGHDSWLSR